MTVRLSDAQKAALDPNLNLVVEAGPGSGKTTVLVERYLSILTQHPELDARHILAITFTKKAAVEMVERIRSRLQNGPDHLPYYPNFKHKILASLSQAKIQTIHGACAGFLREYALALDLDPGFTVLDETARNILMHRTLNTCFDQWRRADQADFAAYLKVYSLRQLRQDLTDMTGQADVVHRWIDTVLGAETFQALPICSGVEFLPQEAAVSRVAHDRTQILCRLFKLFFDQFTQAKRRQNVLDYPDMVAFANRLFDQDDIVAKVRESVAYLMVDEFQDTDDAQWQFVQKLTGISQGAAGGINVFVVGDVKQSIYGFRGADPTLFLGLMAPDDGQDLALVRLSDNFRSQRRLVQFMNGFFAPLFDQFAPEKFQYTPLQGNRADTDSEVSFCVVDPDDGSLLAEANMTAKWILAQKAARSDFCFGEVAVLTRRRLPMSVFGQALAQHGIPVSVHDERGFFQDQWVIDGLNLVRFFLNPADELSLVGVLKSFWFGVSDEAIAWVGLNRGAQGIFAFLQSLASEGNPSKLALLNEADQAALRRCGGVLSQWIALTYGLPISQVFETVVYQSFTAQQLQACQAFELGWPVLVELVETLRSVQNAGAGSEQILHFLEKSISWREVSKSNGSVDPSEKAVNIMTIHAAKGLEFSAVVIAECGHSFRRSGGNRLMITPRGMGLSVPSDDGKTKSVVRTLLQADAQAHQLEEEMRLFFVAVSRAKDQLLILGRHNGESVDSESIRSYLDFVFVNGRLDRQAHTVVFPFSSDEASYPVFPYQKSGLVPEPETDQLPMFEVSSEADQTECHFAPVMLSKTPRIGRLSVSTLLDSVADAPELGVDAATGFRAQKVGAAQFGQMVHACIDRLHWGQPIADLMRQCDGDEAFKAAVTRQLTVYRSSEIYRRVKSADGVRSEKPFSVLHNTVVIEGRWDCVVNTGSDWEIIDYKTDRHPPSSADDLPDRYRRQLRLYTWVLSTTQNVPFSQIRATVYFTQTGQAVTVSFSQPDTETWVSELVETTVRSMR